MLAAGAQYADDGVGAPISLRPSFLRSVSALSGSGERSQCNGNRPTTTDVVPDAEGKNSGSDPPECGPLNRHTTFRSDRARGRHATPAWRNERNAVPPAWRFPCQRYANGTAAGSL